jgi:leader peptidase (prepilin peptidase)/N-methyltransferase
MGWPWLTAILTGALVSGSAVPMLTARGLRHLGRAELDTVLLRRIGAGAGALVGAATTLTALRLGNGALTPPLVVWGAAMVAASCCDAVSQRVPTALVRQALVVTFVLVTCTSAIRGDWSGFLLSSMAAAMSGLVLSLCWRFADVGFGDVRLAVLGGLGLGHATVDGMLLGLGAFIVIITTQAVATLVTGGDRRTKFPFGPALAAGFLVAATA